jgi:serine/threonine protein kinase
MSTSLRPTGSDLEFIVFRQECLQDGVVSYRVQAKKHSLILPALLKLPAYDNPDQSANVTQRREQLVNIANALATAGQVAGGYLPAIIQVGHMAALRDVVKAGLARQFRLNEPYILLEQPIGDRLITVSEPFSLEEAATIIIRVALGVDALHKNGWIHGSLAPDKIYVSPDRALGTLGHFGTLMPDKKGKVNKKIDIYALGMLLYRLLVGNDPQSAPEKFPKMNLVPKQFANVIYKAVASKPNNRYETVSKFIQAVGKAVGWATVKFSQKNSSKASVSYDDGLLSKGDFLSEGRYKIEGVFTSGNQGVIYEAWKMPCGTNTGFPPVPVLIKCAKYKSDDINNEKISELRQQIQHEAEMLQKLYCVGVTPQLIDLFYEKTHNKIINHRAPSDLKNEPYLVMSKIAASSLETIDKPEQTVVIRIGYRLAKTLAVVHAQKVLYQDIKPENILVDSWGTSVFLVDLGSVCPIINGFLHEKSPGYANLTPGYQGPEFDELWEKTDYRFDIYSLGATLFRLLTGICPLKDLHAAALKAIPENLSIDEFEKQKKDADRPVLKKNKLPDSVRPDIAKLIERNRDKRCQDAKTAAQMLRRLERQLLGHPISAPIVLRAECLVQQASVEIECYIPRDIAIAGIVLERNVENTRKTIVRHRITHENTIILHDKAPLLGLASYQIKAETELDNITCLPSSQKIVYAPPLKVNLKGHPGSIIIRWSPRPSTKAYIVLRHNSHVPKNINDGIRIGGDRLDINCRFIEDKAVSPGKKYFYAVIAQYNGNIYSPPAGGEATPYPLPMEPKIIEWIAPKTGQVFLYWKQANPLPDCYIVKELDASQKELGTFEVKAKGFCSHGHAKGISEVFCPDCGEPLRLRYTVSTCSGERRWIRIASRIQHVDSGWVSQLVIAYIHVNQLRADPPQAARATLNWQAVPDVLYRVERQGNKIALVDAPPFIDENIAPGEYHYRVRALVQLNSNEYKYFGSAEVKTRVLEPVPLPTVHTKLDDNVLTLSWDFPAPADKVSAVQILCDADGNQRYIGKIERSVRSIFVIHDLPLGIQVAVRVWGVFGDQISPRPVIKSIMPTAPVKELQVESLIETAKLCWQMPQNAKYCVVSRQTEVGTVVVCEQCRKDVFIDSKVPTDIEVKYEVRPVFKDGVMGRPKTTSTITVPPQPQAPQNLHWQQKNKNLCLKWRLPPEMQYVSGWQIIVSYENSKQKLEVSPDTTFVTIEKLPLWVPIYVQVRALVGTQAGQMLAQCIGGLTKNITVNINASINQVNLQWNSPPLTGRLVVSREGGEKNIKFVVPVNNKFYVDKPSKMDIEYLYSCYFKLEHPEIGTLTIKSSSPQKVFPRSYPVNTESPTVKLHQDGQHVDLTWPSESKGPSVDSYLYLRKNDTKPFSTEPFDIKQLASLIRQANVTDITVKNGGAPNKDYIPHFGITCQYARVAINSLAARISPAVSVTSIPPVGVKSAHFGDIKTTVIMKKLPVWRLIVRRIASDVTIPKQTNNVSGKIRDETIQKSDSNLNGEIESPQLPPIGEAPSFEFLKHISKKLQLEGEGIQLLPPNMAEFVDVSLSAGNAFKYKLLSVVSAADDPNEWFISQDTIQPTYAGPQVIYEFSLRRQWFRQVHKVWYWVASTANEFPLIWIFQLANNETITYNSTKPAGSFALPEKVNTVHIFTPEGDKILGQDIRHLSIEGKEPLPVRVSLWLAQQWFKTNRYLLLTQIDRLCLPNTEIQSQQMKLGKVKVLIPKELGYGDLLFVPKSQNNRPVIQVFRQRPWRLRSRVVEIFCDEEPWLNLTGFSMQKILESLQP